jgi:hypothetical protein
MKKNCRLKDLKLTTDDLNLLNEIAEEIRIKNSDLARLILHQELMRVKGKGIKNYSIALIGTK